MPAWDCLTFFSLRSVKQRKHNAETSSASDLDPYMSRALTPSLDGNPEDDVDVTQTLHHTVILQCVLTYKQP